MNSPLKKILIVFGSLIVLFFGIAAVLPSEYSFSREIEVNAKPSEVFRRVANLNRWPEWSPWYAADPDAVYEFKGTPGEVGSSMSWNSEKVGAGSLTVESLVQDKEVVSRLNFTEPATPPSIDRWTFEATEGGTTLVKWFNEGKANYPMGRYFALAMDSLLAEDFEKGLDTLKTVVETSALGAPLQRVEEPMKVEDKINPPTPGEVNQ